MIKLFDLEVLLELTPKTYNSYMGKVIQWGLRILILLLFIFFFSVYYFEQEREFLFKLMQAGISVGALFSLIILFIQSCIVRQHKQTSIALQKSYKAIKLIYEWSKDSSAEMLLARKIVDKMQLEEVKKLADSTSPVSVAIKDYDMLRGFLPYSINRITDRKSSSDDQNSSGQQSLTESACPHKDNCIAANSHSLSMAETLWLRAWVIKYLNILEVIMYAWKANLVDRDIVEKEFSYLVKTERDGSTVLKDFRDMLGQENFPGIYSFCETLSEKNKKRIVEEKHTG